MERQSKHPFASLSRQMLLLTDPAERVQPGSHLSCYHSSSFLFLFVLVSFAVYSYTPQLFQFFYHELGIAIKENIVVFFGYVSDYLRGISKGQENVYCQRI